MPILSSVLLSDKPRSLVAVYKYKDMYYGRMLATYDENGNINDTIIEKDAKYEGYIVDPEKGKVYDAELWHKASEKDLPDGFSMGDIKDFIPVVPETI